MKKRREKTDNAGKSATSTADSDAEYFLRAMTGVVRLGQDPRGHVRAAPHVPRPRATSSSGPSSAAQEFAEHLETGFAAPGVDRRELRKLKRGDHPPTSQLDLHGMTAAEAVARVIRFIDNNRRHRCVCIIHGRGLHSEANVSILKTRVRACLKTHRAVLAYTDAPRGDGGAGAVYVLLRK